MAAVNPLKIPVIVVATPGRRTATTIAISATRNEYSVNVWPVSAVSYRRRV
jgi:hypothetical protein